MENKYKKSRFIYVSNYNDKKIYYQSISKKMIVLKKEEVTNFENILNNPNNYLDKYPQFLNFLKSYKYIVDISKNEIDELYVRNKIEVFSNKHYMLTINPTLNCNLSCWYCDAKVNNKSSISDINISNIKKHIYHLFNSKKITGIHLDWFGGEPLLQFDRVVYPLSKYAKEQACDKFDFTNHMTTNAVLFNTEIIRKCNEINLNSFQITMDGIENKHNSVKNISGKPTYKVVVNNIIEILSVVNMSSVVLRINYDNETLKNIESIFGEFPKELRCRIFVDFQRVWQTKKEASASENLEKALNLCIEYGYKTHYVFFDPRPYHTCYSDKYFHAVVNYDGNVYKCTSGDYKSEDIKGVLLDDGRIEWNDNVNNLFLAPTFDNEKCRECVFLSFCYGPCSNKIEKFKKLSESFEDICPKSYHEIELDKYLVFLAKSNNLV